MRKNSTPRLISEAFEVDPNINLQISGEFSYLLVRFIFHVDQLIEAGSQSPSHIVVRRGAKRKSENFKLRAVVELK
jgi:hypothetical protein